MSPFTKRILVMLGMFVLLLPVARVLDQGSGHIVKATGLPGATVSGSPLTVSTATSTTAASVPDPSAQDTSPAGDTSSTASTSAARTSAARPAYSQSAPKRSSTTSSGGSAKTSATTAAKASKASSPPTTAKAKAKPPVAPKPPVTTAPKPAPPVTTAPPPPSTYTTGQIVAIIRQIWPANLADQAIAIAQRESHLNPTSHNYCCYGLFAIYFEAGKKLLNSIGITSPQQLYDPVTNTRAAYAIYLAAGWTPWKL